MKKEMKKKVKRYILFEDNEGYYQILPIIGNTINNKTEELMCKNVDCACYSITCDRCPLADSWSLNRGEFKILELKSEDDK